MAKYDELKRLAEKATPGPWWIDSHGYRMSTEDGTATIFVTSDKMGPAVRNKETGNLSHWPNDWNASFIAAANPSAILALISEVETLRAEVNEQARLNGMGSEREALLMAERDQLRAEVEALRKHLTECADSLESEILDRYGSSKDHPAMRRKFECDMRDVIEARAAIGKGERNDG